MNKDFGTNRYGYIINFLGDPLKKHLSEEDLTPLHYAQLQNMCIDAMRELKPQKLDDRSVEDLANFAVPLDVEKVKFKDKVFGSREGFILEAALFHSKQSENEALKPLKGMGVDLSYRVNERGKDTHLPYDINVVSHTVNKNTTPYSIAHINNNEGIVFRNLNDKNAQRDIAKIILNTQIANTSKQSLKALETFKEISQYQTSYELAAGTQALSLLGSLVKDGATIHKEKSANSKFSSDLKDVAMRINVLNDKIKNGIKGFGAGISGTSMALWLITDDYIKRGKLQVTDEDRKRMVMAIIRHVVKEDILGNANIDIDVSDKFNHRYTVTPTQNRNTEVLHHSLPEVLMGIDIANYFIDNGIDFDVSKNQCAISPDDLQKKLIEICDRVHEGMKTGMSYNDICGREIPKLLDEKMEEEVDRKITRIKENLEKELKQSKNKKPLNRKVSNLYYNRNNNATKDVTKNRLAYAVQQQNDVPKSNIKSRYEILQAEGKERRQAIEAKNKANNKNRWR